MTARRLGREFLNSLNFQGALIAFLVLAGALLTPLPSHAASLTLSVPLGDQDFADGQLIVSVAEFEGFSLGEPPPFDAPIGFNGTIPFSASWSFAFDPAEAKGAKLTFGICDHDGAASGDQVASFTIDGVDATAAANAAFNAGGGTQLECNVFSFPVPATATADGSVTIALTLQGPSLIGSPGTVEETAGPGNSAGLDFSTLDVELNQKVQTATPPSAPPVGGIGFEPDIDALALASPASFGSRIPPGGLVTAVAGVLGVLGVVWYAKRRSVSG